MAPTQNSGYFPYCPLPPPPPHSSPPPPKQTPPPPPHNFPPPPHHPISPPPHNFPPPPPPPRAPPPAHSSPPPPPHVKPPPHPILPPPPHIVPPPSPPGHHSTVIIVVFISLGSLFFLAFLSVALCCFIKKRKRNMVQETDIVDINDHRKIQEVIIPGPHGSQAVIMSVEEDVQEEIIKGKKATGGSHFIPAHHHPQGLHTAAQASGSNHYHIENKG